MNPQAARIIARLPVPWPGAVLALGTLALFLPAFYWLIYVHWYLYNGSFLGVIPLVLSCYWVRQLIQHFPKGTLQLSMPASLLLAGGLWLLLAGYSAQASAIVGWSCALVIPALAWFYGGKRALALAWFPALCLALAFPIPNFFEHHLGLYARVWSAILAKLFLAVVGMDVTRAGTFLTAAGGIELDVGNACSGVRTMHVFLVAALLLLQPLRLHPRRFFALLPAFFLASVLANGARVAALVLIATKLNPKWLEGPSHELTGLIFFLITFLPLALLVSRWGNRAKPEAEKEAMSPVQGESSSMRCFVIHGALLGLSVAFLISLGLRKGAELKIEAPDVPYLLGGWAGRDELLAAHEIEFYGVSGLHKRVYVRRGQRVEYVSNTAPISREGLHSPAGCFTSLGWRLLDRNEAEGGKAPIVWLKLERPAADVRQVVLFWFMDKQGNVVASERELTWHALTRRITLRPEEVWTLHCLAVPVEGDGWEMALETAKELGAEVRLALTPKN